jgi:predicted DNA-binding transcriptional regulator YafY
MNRTDRLVALVLYLQGRRVVCAEEMAEHFEISVRTVYRDIAALGEAGVPIAGEAGVGYSLMKGYHLPPVMFNTKEASALFLGGEMVRQFTDSSLRAPVNSALEKLRAVLPRDRQDQIERLARNTVIMGRPVPAGSAAGGPWLSSLQQGIVERCVLRMAYRARNREDDTVRDVEPLGVVFYGGAWYLVAWCRLRQDFRHFRIDRIRSLDFGRETFSPRPDFSLSQHLEKTVGQGDTIPARIWLTRRAEDRARRESHATLVRECGRDGGAEFSLFTFSLEWLARWLLSFGSDAEALAPARLRQLVCAEAGKVACRHAEKSPDITLSVRRVKVAVS